MSCFSKSTKDIFNFDDSIVKFKNVELTSHIGPIASPKQSPNTVQMSPNTIQTQMSIKCEESVPVLEEPRKRIGIQRGSSVLKLEKLFPEIDSKDLPIN